MHVKMRVIQCGSSVMGIQMKLMKVSGTDKNRMVQEFQHCTESKLTEDSRMKRQRTQFASSVMGIQMKLMKVIRTRENRIVQ
jgi:hypothetical protein